MYVTILSLREKFDENCVKFPIFLKNEKKIVKTEIKWFKKLKIQSKFWNQKVWKAKLNRCRSMMIKITGNKPTTTTSIKKNKNRIEFSRPLTFVDSDQNGTVPKIDRDQITEIDDLFSFSTKNRINKSLINLSLRYARLPSYSHTRWMNTESKCIALCVRHKPIFGLKIN